MQYYGSKLSKNMAVRQPEGYLLCLNVPIARTGEQQYMPYELGLEGRDPIPVTRTAEEVFSPDAMASFEGLPVCDDHPFDEVNTANIGAYAKGHVQNVRRGSPPEQDLLLADIVITHRDLIDKVLAGKREISCGYNAEYTRGADGKLYQKGIRGNHVAVVTDGRAGSRVAIRDAINKRKGTANMTKQLHTYAKALTRLIKDSVPEVGLSAVEDLLEGIIVPEEENALPQVQVEPPQAEPLQADEGEAPAENGLEARLTALEQAVEALRRQAVAAADTQQPCQEPGEDVEHTLNTDADAEEEPQRQEEPDEDNVSAAVRDTLRDLCQTVAALPEEYRKPVSDSMAEALRKHGVGAVQASLEDLAQNRRTARDSVDRDEELERYGKRLMEKYNPHYRA